MIRAMDRTGKSHGRRARIALLAASVLTGPLLGCTQLRSFRGEPKVGGVVGPAVDPYLAHHRVVPPPAMPGAGTALAQAEPAGGTGFVRSSDLAATAESGGEGIVPTEVVTLGSPVAVPTARNPRPGSSTPSLNQKNKAATREMADDARSVVARSRAALDAMGTYQVQINRQERVGGVLLPAEDVQLSVRRSPKAVRLEWPSGAHKGREAIYAAGEGGGLLHVHMGDSLVPVPNLSLPPDSPLVMKNSRHPITEAGFDALVTTLERGVSDQPDGASTTYRGMETPTAVGHACHKIERHNASGETWFFYLDAQTALPAMVEGTSPTGELLERYVFHDVKPNVTELTMADAFDPAKRWGGASSLLGRLARTTTGDARAPATTPR